MKAHEIWKPIDGFPKYEVSNLGRLRSWYRQSNRRAADLPYVFTGTPDGDGYLRVSLKSDTGRPRTMKVQRIVASAFLGEKPAGLVIAHKNGTKEDNSADNLSYKTQRENIADKEQHGTKLLGAKHPMSRLTEVQAREIKYGRARVNDLAKKFGIPKSTAWNVRLGACWRWL